MRLQRIALSMVVLGFAACQDAGGPVDPATDVLQAAARSDQADQVSGDWVFRFERLEGNDVTGANGLIRDRNAAGARWRLDRGEARLSQRGELRVKVEGLVLQNTGANPLAGFRGVLSCQTTSDNALVNVSVVTDLAPADAGGDAEIRERLSGIPSPCYAPIVFVTTPGGAWIAVSGF